METNSTGRAVAIISYISFIGWIIALILHINNRTSLGAFHLRQALGIFILSVGLGFTRFLLNISMHYVGYIIGLVLVLWVVVLWIMGLIYAIQGREKEIPVFGDRFQGWFENTIK